MRRNTAHVLPLVTGSPQAPTKNAGLSAPNNAVVLASHCSSMPATSSVTASLRERLPFDHMMFIAGAP